MAKGKPVKVILLSKGMAVSFAPGLEPETAELWNDFILCLEHSAVANIKLDLLQIDGL